MNNTFERELEQADYELQKALEDSIISLKKGGMTRTSFYNMMVRKGKECIKYGITTPKTEIEHLNKVMRIWDVEDLR
jgi:hypothetical protein